MKEQHPLTNPPHPCSTHPFYASLTSDQQYHQPASNPARVWGAAYRIPSEKVAKVREYLDLREINGYTIEYKTFYPALWAVCHDDDGDDGDGGKGDGDGSEGVLQPERKQTDTSVAGQYPDLPEFLTTPFPCLVYVGHPTNPQYLGVQDPDLLASRIVESRGPSGENREYLYELDGALAKLLDEPYLQAAIRRRERPGRVRLAASFAEDCHIADLTRRCKDLERRRMETTTTTTTRE